MINPARGKPVQQLTAALLSAATLLGIIASARALTVVTWDGEQADATIAGYEPGKNLLVKVKDQTDKIPLSEMHMLRVAAAPLTQSLPTELPVLWLDSGGWLAISNPVFANDQLSFESAFAGAAKIEMNQVRAIAFQKSAIEGFASAEFKRHLKQPPKTDVLMIAGGNQVVSLEGVFVRLDDKGFVFRWQNAEQVISRDRVIALVLAPIKREVPPEATDSVFVRGNDGSALQGRLTALTGEVATLEVAGLNAVKLKMSQISVIDFGVARAVYVSALEPAHVTETPYLDHVFHFRKDESIGGNPLSIKGVTYERGLGVHSKTALTYAIDKKYRRLAGFIGIDAEVGSRGDAVLKVLADGKEIFNSGPVKGGEEPRRLSVPVDGADKLTLEVDFGEDMDIADHADWADLKLIK